jgi:hypothetical protein
MSIYVTISLIFNQVYSHVIATYTNYTSRDSAI